MPPINPNVVTTLRLPLAPVAVAFLLTDTLWGAIAAAVLAIVLEITDVADGYLARAYDVVTDFGKLYDPFSDAFCRYTLFLGLYAAGVADLWMVIAIFYRDSSVSFFRSIAAMRRQVVGARWSGKAKAWLQGVGMQVIFLCLVLQKTHPDWPLETIPWWTMLVITLGTMVSFVDYFFGFLPVLRDAWFNRPHT